MMIWSKTIARGLALVAISAVLVACGTSNSTGGSSNHSRRADINGMYRVRSGDTLGLIARANGVSYQDIMRWNGLTNPDQIEVGWKLRVRPGASGVGNSKIPSNNGNGSGVAVIRADIPKAADKDLSANPTINNSLSWVWPTSGGVLKRFDGAGSRGVVLSGNMNDPVVAASSGVVIYAGNSLRGYGNMIVIKHNETWSSVYANNSTLFVKQGDRVNAGQTIASMGNSDAQRVQLYFEVRMNAKPIDPMKVLPARTQ